MHVLYQPVTGGLRAAALRCALRRRTERAAGLRASPRSSLRPDNSGRARAVPSPRCGRPGGAAVAALGLVFEAVGMGGESGGVV